MALWTSLKSLFRRKEEKRLSLDEYQELIYNLQGTPYLIGTSSGLGGSVEEVENSFAGYVNGAYKSNGIVFACMLARMMIFSEARFQFQRLRNGRPGDLFGMPDLGIFERPWPNGTTGELLARAIQDADLAGNHYVLRESRTRLRRLRPDWVDIILTADPNIAEKVDVAGYMYTPGGYGNGEPAFYLPEQIAHWSPIPDPEAQYRGMSWLTPVLREIHADKAATTHKAKYFERGAGPKLAVSLKESVTKEQFQEFMELMNSNHDGLDNAYRTLFLGGGADVTVVGADLRQLDFKATQGAGETRIAAAARVHPVIVGLSEGMQGSSLNAGNFTAAKDQFGDGTLRPLWRSIAAAYESLVTVPGNARLWYDDRDIAFLRGDLAEIAKIRKEEALTIESLIRSGYEPDSVTTAMLAQDWSLLVHTGLYSVQLQPPMPKGAPISNKADSPNPAE